MHDGWMDGWMDRWMDGYIYIYLDRKIFLVGISVP
jgi:hypothetical protein